MATPPPEDNEDNNPEWMGKYEGPPDFSTTYDQRPKRNPHATAMAVLRGKLAEARGLYEQAIVEANALRPGYVEAYSVWWESTRRANGSAGGWVPEHVNALEAELKAAGAVVFDRRRAVERCRKWMVLLEWARARGEVSTCPSCKHEAAVLTYEDSEDVSECCVCEHLQVRRVSHLRHTPSRVSEAATMQVKWERGPRTKHYYI